MEEQHSQSDKAKLSVAPVGGEEAAAVDYAAPGSEVPAELQSGHMPAWTVGELPEPPSIKRGVLALLGPGLMMAGAAIGGGEWLMGPAVTAQYGGVIMWLALASILTQLAYNLGVMRYALYCGESIFVGYMRLLPGPRFWTCVYLFVDFFGLWPYLAANAAVPLAAAILGHLPGALPTNYLPADELSRRTGVEVRVVEDIKANPARYGTAAGQTPPPQPIVEIMRRETTLRNWLAYGIFAGCFIPLIFG